jgi:hypothetical protein
MVMCRPPVNDACSPSQDEIKEKLKNPNMFVSKTRLSVHNMPKSCNEKTLREKLQKSVSKLGPIRQVRLGLIRAREVPQPFHRPWATVRGIFIIIA